MDINSLLIVSNFRTGSSYLGKHLAQRYSLNYYNEPLDLKFRKGSCVKLIPSDKVNYSKEEVIDFARHFDYIILLERHDKKSQAESLEAIQGIPHSQLRWQAGEYNYDRLKPYYDMIKDVDNKLKWISEKLNIDIISYEDLYESDAFDFKLDFNPNILDKLRVGN